MLAKSCFLCILKSNRAAFVPVNPKSAIRTLTHQTPPTVENSSTIVDNLWIGSLWATVHNHRIAIWKGDPSASFLETKHTIDRRAPTYTTCMYSSSEQCVSKQSQQATLTSTPCRFCPACNSNIKRKKKAELRIEHEPNEKHNRIAAFYIKATIKRLLPMTWWNNK